MNVGNVSLHRAHRIAPRRFMLAAMLALAGMAGALNAFAQTVRVVVPYPAGGTPDILARTLAEHAAAALGQSVIVENRAGAGGNIGATAVSRSKPDGETLLLCAFSCTVAQSLFSPAPFNIEQDFSPVVMLATVPSVLVANPAVPAKSLPELVAYAREHPGKLRAASSGFGGSAHLALELFKQQAGIDILHVPYKGAGQVAPDLLGGHVDLYFDNLPASLQSIRDGRLIALGVAGPDRVPAIPDVPTFKEAGIPGVEILPWFGLMAPAGTPDEKIRALNAAFNAALSNQAVRQRLIGLGLHIQGGSTQQLAAFLSANVKQWFELIRRRGLQAQ